MAWIERLVNVFRRGRLDDDIDAELQFHVDMRAADFAREGLSETDARRKAVSLLGNRASLRDRTREADVWLFLETTVQDVRYAIRLLARTPVFTAAAALTLAIGIGVNTAMFGVLYGVVIRPLPYVDADRLYVLFQSTSAAASRTRLSPLDFIDVQQRSRAFDIVGTVGTGFTITGARDPELVIGHMVAGDLFGVLGAAPLLGRTIGSADQAAGGANVMVLSHTLWQRRFGGDPDVVGQTILANGRPFTVVGVMPASFSYLGPRYQLWVPLPLRAPNPDNLPITRTSRFVQVLGRLRPDVTPAAAADDLAAIASGLRTEYPDVHRSTAFVTSPLVEETVGNVRPALRLLFAAVLLVLLIACGNVTSLLLTRFSGRTAEVTIRAAVGASRLRMIRQFLVETLVLYVIGTAAGVVLASWLLGIVRTLAPATIPRVSDIALTGPVLFFAVGVSLAFALAFGLAPAWQALRSMSPSAVRSKNMTPGRVQVRFRSAVVVAQIATALCLLAGASLVARSLLNLTRVDKGFDAEGRYTFNVVMPAARYPTGDVMRAFYRRMLDTLSAQPGFVVVGATTHLPLSGQDLENGFAVPGYTPPSPDQPPLAALRGVSPEYVTAMGIALEAGRLFTARDDENAARVALVNETFARRYLAGKTAVGSSLSVGGPGGPSHAIVGVVADVRHRGLAADARPEVLLPYWQLDEGFLTAFARGMSVVVRSDLDAAAAGGAIRAQIRQLDADLPVIDLRPMEALVSDAVAEPRFRTFVLVSFALVALVLAAVGVFGVMAYLVSERTREFGVRLALGARPAMIFRDVLRHGVRLVAIGSVAGLIGAAVFTRWARQLLFQVSPADPLMVGGALVALAATAIVAALIPAWRATRVNPVVALRA